MTQQVVRRIEDHFDGAGGRSLFRRAWLPEQAERVLCVVHGYAEHSGRYEGLGRWFAERGFAVHAYDHQGHGRSDGPRCHVRRFDDFLDDLGIFVERSRGEHPGLPVFPVGHSMGGLILAAFLRERSPDVAGAITSGAALALSDGLSRVRIAAARILRRVAPRLSIGSGLDPNGLSRDPAVVQAYLDDPYVYRTMTTSLGAALIDAVGRTGGGGAEVRVPMLLLHGAEDPLCPAAGSRAFYAAITTPGSALAVYPGLRHEIFNEPEREAVFRDVLSWIDERSRAWTTS